MDILSKEGPYNCLACGACCVEAGRVTVSPEDKTPRSLTEKYNGESTCMSKYMGGRYKTLEGVIGLNVSYSVYSKRPKVCREYQPGSEGCLDSRERANVKLQSSFKPRGYGLNWIDTI